MGGLLSKRRGTGYEYRVKEWLKKRGWDSERNPLSGASVQITEEVSKHDVRASKDGIFLQIECKKSGSESLILQHLWIEKIDFTNDEFLVFAMKRSDHYALVPFQLYCELTNSTIDDYEVDEFRKISGKKSCTLHVRDLIKAGSLLVLDWIGNEEKYAIVPFEDFMTCIEARGPRTDLENDAVEFVKACSSEKELNEWLERQPNLSYKERRVAYAKLERLAGNINENAMRGDFVADQEWWLSDEKKFLFVCPFCENNVTSADLKNKKDKPSED